MSAKIQNDKSMDTHQARLDMNEWYRTTKRTRWRHQKMPYNVQAGCYMHQGESATGQTDKSKHMNTDPFSRQAG